MRLRLLDLNRRHDLCNLGIALQPQLSANLSTASAQIGLRCFGNSIHLRMGIRSAYHYYYVYLFLLFAKFDTTIRTGDHSHTGGNPSSKKGFVTVRAMIHHRRHPRSDAQNDPQKPYHLRRGIVNGNENDGE